MKLGNTEQGHLAVGHKERAECAGEQLGPHRYQGGSPKGLEEGGLGVCVGLWPAPLRRLLGEEPSVVLFGSLADTFLGGTFCAEGGHEVAILASQDKDVRIRLVQEIVSWQPRRSFAQTLPLVTIML
jgi:hypothetical protein